MSPIHVALDPSGIAAALRSKGFVLVPGALSAAGVERLDAALNRVYAEERLAGRLGDGDAMHVLGGLGRDPAFVELIDHHAVFPAICAELGWNIHVYHAHLDVTPPRDAPRTPPVWGWHQDGGRQNLDMAGVGPRPRLSLKVAFWISDVSEPGRGNMLVIPGSCERNSLARPRAGESFEQPRRAEPVLARAGDALIFDRRLWHSRSDNLSAITRKAIFVAYTFRWIRPRDDLGVDRDDPRYAALTPIRKQLLGGEASPHSCWGLERDSAPLRAELDRRGALDPAIPCHR
jgi:Phytanoyl-CoA dioxygenase (PhyH)